MVVSRIIRAVVLAFAVIGVAYVAMIIVVTNGFPGMKSCFSYHIMDVPSPTKAFLATVQNDTCSKTGELQTVVHVSGTSGDSRSAFVAPSAMQEAGVYSPMPLRLVWLGDAELRIEYPSGVQADSMVETVNGVKVVYRQFDSRP